MKLFENSTDTTDIWSKYQKGIDHHNKLNLYDNAEKYHRFFQGDQWYGLEGDGEILPIMNFIQPIVKYKVANICQNNMSINYSPMDLTGDVSEQQQYKDFCELFNKHASAQWERTKMDTLCWSAVKDACIAGNSFIYFSNKGNKAQILDHTNVYLSDEQSSDIQSQKYIIIFERRFVSDVKDEATQNKIPENEIDLIISDSDTDNVLGIDDDQEIKTTDGKCTCLLYMEKDKDGIVHITKSTKNVIYQPDTPLTVKNNEDETVGGLKAYPLVSYVWEDKKGSARGKGEVEGLINNQIELNRTYARIAIHIKSVSFPKIIYNENMVDDVKKLNHVGAEIGVNSMTDDVKKAITYLNPAAMSNDVNTFTNDILNLTQELAGAGDAATGAINPEKASGAAIIAARDQAALPLNEQVSKYKQLIEDIASVWYEMWVAYNPNGLTISVENDGGFSEQKTIPSDVLENMKINIRIDISPKDPYSKYAQQTALDKLTFEYQQQTGITFDEYIELLDDDSSVPKAKLLDLLQERNVEAQKEAQRQAELQQYTQIIQKQQQVIQQLQANMQQPQQLQGQMPM